MLDKVVANLGDEAVSFFQATIKDAWGRLSEEERRQVQTLLQATAETRIRELAGEDVGQTAKILESALLQWKVAGKSILVSAFRETSREVLGLGGEFLGGVLRGVLAKV